jgi:hypothetical protein
MSFHEVTQLHVQAAHRTDGHTADGVPGDCYRAAIASLLGEPAETVPHFGLYLSWWDETRRWLQRQRGLDLAYFEASDLSDDPFARTWGHDPRLPVLVGGRSPRGDFGHVVVGLLDGTVLWDPHPSRAGLRTVDEFFVVVMPYGYLPDRLMLTA